MNYSVKWNSLRLLFHFVSSSEILVYRCVFIWIASLLSRAQLAMERCAAPRPESTSPPDPVTSTESAAETGGDADVYECRICGYKVTNVKCLSQHLQAAHPVTSLPDSSSLGNKRCETQTECGGGVGDDGETSSLNGELASHVKEKVSYELLLSSEQLHEFGYPWQF